MQPPSSLYFFGPFELIAQVMQKRALPIKSLIELSDPYLPAFQDTLEFDKNELFDLSVHHITSNVFGRSMPAGNPSNPIYKAEQRWRAENRFNDPSEVKQALSSLLPNLIEQHYREASSEQRKWYRAVAELKIAQLYNTLGLDLLWQYQAKGFTGAAIKFAFPDEVDNLNIQPVNYAQKPLASINPRTIIKQMCGEISEETTSPIDSLLTDNKDKRQFKEWRVLVKASSDQWWLPIRENFFRAVYLGPLIKDEHKKQLENLAVALGSRFEVFQGKTHLNGFSLDWEKP